MTGPTSASVNVLTNIMSVLLVHFHHHHHHYHTTTIITMIISPPHQDCNHRHCHSFGTFSPSSSPQSHHNNHHNDYLSTSSGLQSAARLSKPTMFPKKIVTHLKFWHKSWSVAMIMIMNVMLLMILATITTLIFSYFFPLLGLDPLHHRRGDKVMKSHLRPRLLLVKLNHLETNYI